MTKVGNVSKVGKRHILAKEICQDRSVSGERIYLSGGNDGTPVAERIHYIAVADGVGSAAYGGIGADYALKVFLENVEKLYRVICCTDDSKKANQSFNKFMRFLRHSAIHFAENIGATKEELATTLSFAIVGTEKTLVVSIGDSPVCIKLAGKNLIRKTGNVEGALSNETVSAFSSCSWDVVYAEVFETSTVEAVFCVSDGADLITHPKDDTDPIEWIKDILNGDEDIDHIASEIVGLQNDDVSIAYIAT